MRYARNEKRHLSRSIVVLSLSLVASTACWAQSTRTIGGNAVVQRAGHDSVGGDFFVVDTNQPFTNDGALTSWEIFAETTNPIQLVIYRNTGGSIVEVGRSALVTPTLGYNLFSLPPQPMISVLAGDFVGVHTTAGSVVSDSIDGNVGGTCFPGLFYGAWFGFTSVSTNLTCSQDRHYSVRAFRQNPSP